MKTGHLNFRDNILSCILVPLIMVIGVVSYFRFIVNNDYMVRYEGTCDHVTQKCFLGCENDACIKEYYYSEVLKYAPDLYRECGQDITDCDVANTCLPDDRKCSVTYCDEKINGDTCEKPAGTPAELNNNTNNSI